MTRYRNLRSGLSAGAGLASLLTQQDAIKSHRDPKDGPRAKETVAKPADAKQDRYKSKWEREYAALLEEVTRDGRVTWWAYEPIRLRLPGGPMYTPDFIVQWAFGELEAIEIKGFWREAAKVRYRVAVACFPWLKFSAVTKRDGEWVPAI